MELLPVFCLLLITFSSSSVAQDSAPPISRQVEREDDDIILGCSLGTSSVSQGVFHWKLGQRNVFYYEKGQHYNNGLVGQDPQFRGRVFHFPQHLDSGNASILIRKAEVRDGGNYTCNFPRVQPKTRASIQLVVGAAQRPIISRNKTKDGALLQCEVLGASPKPVVEWWDSSGNVLPAEDPKVKPQDTPTGLKFDVFLQTTVTKSGFYRCVATQEEIYSQVSTETYVVVPGAAPEPSLTILEDTSEQALLQCVVRGASPKPVVVWKDGSGNLLPSEAPEETERGGSYDVVLRTTVTQTDYYHCVATQEEIHHQVSFKIHVFFGEKQEPREDPTSKVTVGVVGVLVVGLLVGLVAGYYLARRCRKRGG